MEDKAQSEVQASEKACTVTLFVQSEEQMKHRQQLDRQRKACLPTKRRCTLHSQRLRQYLALAEFKSPSCLS